MLHQPSTARRAGITIALITVFVALAGGLAMRVLDTDEFPTVGSGIWWALQTITTVGYGDHVPAQTDARVVAAVLMVTGIGFLTIVTASISAAFVESARRRTGHHSDDLILERLERIEQALERLRTERSS